MWINSIVTAVLGSRVHGLLSRRLIALRITGRRTGARYVIPVEYAAGHDHGLVAFPGGFDHKNWWRNFREPAPVEILYHGSWRAGMGRLVTAADDDEYLAALSAYHGVFPRMVVPPTAPFVLLSMMAGPSTRDVRLRSSHSERAGHLPRLFER